MRSVPGHVVDLLFEMMAAEPVETVALDRLIEDVARLQADIDRLQVELGRRLRAVKRRAAHARDGYPSATAFLKHRCRMTSGRAARSLAEASALAEMPITSKLVASGEISLDQARVLIRARDEHPEPFARDEAMLADVARETTFVSHLATAVAHWKQAVSDPDDLDRLFDRRSLYVSKTLDGMVRLDGWLDPEAGEVVLDALDGAMPAPTAGDVRTGAQRRADALVDLVSGRSARRVPEVIVHVGDDRLAGRAETQGGHVVADRALARLLCDAAIHRVVFDSDRRPIEVGRTRRLVTGAQRRALVARDRGCRFPGCDRPHRWTDAHHIVPWSRGGPTRLDNLVLLCRHHHTLVHDGGWSLSGTATDLRVERPPPP